MKLRKIKTSLNQQKGFSLIELMIALAIGILLMASVLMIMVSASQSGRVSDAETAMNEEGIIALSLLQQQIRLAGYSNTNAGTGDKNFNEASIRGCDKGFVSVVANFGDLDCNASGSASSAIAIRYEADKLNTVPVGSGTPPTTPSNCVMEGITADTSSAATGASFALADNRYYAKTSGTGSGRFELYCRGAKKAVTTGTAADFSGEQPLIENIEALKLTYGIVASKDDDDYQIVTYASANDIDTWFAAESVAERWKRVASVKICILMRSAEVARDNSVSGQTYKDCDGANQTSTDGYLRRAYITTAQLRNKASVPLEKQ